VSGNILQPFGKYCRLYVVARLYRLLRFVKHFNSLIYKESMFLLTVSEWLNGSRFRLFNLSSTHGFSTIGFFLTILNHHLPF